MKSSAFEELLAEKLATALQQELEFDRLLRTLDASLPPDADLRLGLLKALAAWSRGAQFADIREVAERLAGLVAAPRGADRPLSRVLARLEELGCRPVGSNGAWRALCPAHDDRRPSLSVGEGDDGRVLLKCHAGCSTEDVLARLGLTWSGLFPDGGSNGSAPRRGRQRSSPPPAETQEASPGGKFATEALARRFIEETGLPWEEARRLGVAWDRDRQAIAFTWLHTRAVKLRVSRDGKEKWRWDVPEGERKPSVWPEPTPETLSGSTAVVLTEGERDALALRSLGLPAFSITAGAGTQPRQEDIARLLALGVRRFVLAFDADQAGGDGEGKARGAIYATAKRWRLRVEVDNLPLPLEAVAEGCKDWVDAVRVLGGEAVENSIPPILKSGSWAESNFSLFLPASSLLSRGESATAWTWTGYLSQGGVTLLSARAKAGKTTLTAHLLRALLGGQGEFLGQPVAFPADGRVALLSEEPDGLVADRLRALGLESDRLLVAFRHQAQGLSFVDVVRQALEQGARLVVVDTVRAWAGIEDENAASDVEAALRPVVSLCQERGASLLLLHHLRKSDGTDGTAHRGSGHLVAMVDVAIEMRRPEGNAPETRRVLRSLSRYPDTPPELVIELQEDTYHALGTGARVQHQQARQALLDTLPGPADEPIPFEARAREGEEAPDCIMARLKAYDLPRSTVQRALAELVAEGVVERHGSGRKGDPFRYRLAPGGENAFPPNPHSIMGGMNSGPRRSQGTQAAAPFGVTADMLQAEGFEPEDDDCIVIGPEADAAPPPADSPPHPLASCPQCRPAPAPWWQWGYQVCRRGPTLVRNVGSAEKHLLRHLPGAAESGPFLAISEALLEEARPRYLVARITGYGTGWLDLTKDPGRPVRHQEPQRAWPLSAFAWEARQPKLPQTGPPA